jgi:predicted cupin superfamily sugar epimerase
MISAPEIISLLDLSPHPEGGWYKETFRDEEGPDGRPRSTAIFFLLEAEQESAWHRVDAVECWHFYDGAPLELRLAGEGQPAITLVLGQDLEAGQRPQLFVPVGCWQSTRPLTTEAAPGWSLVGCTVAPGFTFEGFEMAPNGWTPGTN